ncbi:MAG TPA: SRPBCC family protein [Thermomicrobiales bacterium]|nr:SRPBCC family protein [Thermomicrobiales bacterium]
MKFEHSFTVNATVADTWDFLMNIPEMAGCIPGASDIAQVDDTTYDANVKAKIGPIGAKFACRVAIVALDPAARTGLVELTGKDSKLGSSVKAKMNMSMTEDDGGTTVTVVTDADVLGKIGQYGHGMIGKRADSMFADFTSCVKTQLEQR